jgi:hypothetical protein
MVFLAQIMDIPLQIPRTREKSVKIFYSFFSFVDDFSVLLCPSHLIQDRLALRMNSTQNAYAIKIPT